MANPIDLDGLRDRLGGGPERRTIGLGSVTIASDALDHLAGAVAAVRRDGPIVVVVDETPMVRAGADLKAAVMALLSARFETRLAVIQAAGLELHADQDALEQADTAIAGAGCIEPSQQATTATTLGPSIRTPL